MTSVGQTSNRLAVAKFELDRDVKDTIDAVRDPVGLGGPAIASLLYGAVITPWREALGLTKDMLDIRATVKVSESPLVVQVDLTATGVWAKEYVNLVGVPGARHIEPIIVGDGWDEGCGDV